MRLFAVSLSIFLTALVTFGPLTSRASNACRDVLAEPALSFLQPENVAQKKTVELFERGLLARYGRSPEVLDLVKQLQKMPDPGRVLSVEFDWTGAIGEVEKEIVGNVIKYKIPAIIVRDDHGKYLALQSRPKGINMEFSKLLTAIFLSMKADSKRDPSTREFILVGGYVMNQGLMEILGERGFVRTGTGEFTDWELSLKVRPRTL